MKKDPRLPLVHILQAIQWIEDDTKGLDFSCFSKDRRVRQLAERNLEIISEASRRIPESLKQAHPEIEWREIAGIGNVLRHDYHDVVPTILWAIISRDLSALKATIQIMVESLPGRN